MKPAPRLTTPFFLSFVLILSCLTHTQKNLAFAGGFVSKPDQKSKKAERPFEPQPALKLELEEKKIEPEINVKGEIQLIEKGTVREKAEQIISHLKNKDVTLFDWVVSLEAIDSFDALKKALEAYEGKAYAKIPSDEQILAQLKMLLTNVRAMNLSKEETTILSANDFLEKAESFYSIGLDKQKKYVPVINFEKKWNKLKSNWWGFNRRFYEDLYHALSKEEVVMASEYPDETDRALNQYPDVQKLSDRRQRLIIFLASIKDPNKPRELSWKIKADRNQRVPYSTSANSPSWFHDKRYKLYKIAEQLPNMSTEDKGILLSSFLHAGQHCSVAKRFQIDESYRRFANADAKALNAELYARARNLEERIEIALAAVKDTTLDNLTRSALEREKQDVRTHGEGRHSLAELEAEEVTFLDATYDTYAHNFGLKKRDCLYSSYKLNISTEEAFGKSGYRIKTILNELKREMENKIHKELAGDLFRVLKDPDLIMIGFLKQKRFIVDPSSNLAKGNWSERSAPANDLRPEPVAPLELLANSGLNETQQQFLEEEEDEEDFVSINRIPISGSMPSKFGITKFGRVPKHILKAISKEIHIAQTGLTQKHYEEIVRNPELAINDSERLAALSAREVLVLIDQSGSMNAPDECPINIKGQGKVNWTRWDSANVATQEIVNMALSFDQDAQVDVMIFSGKYQGELVSKFHSVSSSSEVANFFADNRPQRGNTPTAEALEEIYEKRLRRLLNHSEPFTCIILTDGQPNNPRNVFKFFKKFIEENNLEKPGRESLATFSFVRIGDDHGAINFLQDLDDNLIMRTRVNVDIVNVKEDLFLFGEGKYRNQLGIGPFTLFWHAIYD